MFRHKPNVVYGCPLHYLPPNLVILNEAQRSEESQFVARGSLNG